MRKTENWFVLMLMVCLDVNGKIDNETLFVNSQSLPFAGATGKNQVQPLYEVLKEYDSLNAL